MSAPRPPVPPGLNVAALISLILSLVGGTVISLVLGIIALAQIRRSGQRGKPLAVIGVVLSSLGIVLVAVAVAAGVMSGPTRAGGSKLTKGGTILVTDLQVGDCLQKWATSSPVGQVTVVPCSSPHDAEVFHSFPVAGTAFPGDRQVNAVATTTCLAKGRTELRPADQRRVEIAYLKPLAESWAQGAHSVTCVAVAGSGTLSRSVRA